MWVLHGLGCSHTGPLPAASLWVSPVLNVISGLAGWLLPCSWVSSLSDPAWAPPLFYEVEVVRGMPPGDVYHRWRGGCGAQVSWAPQLFIPKTPQAWVAVFAQTAAGPVAL